MEDSSELPPNEAEKKAIEKLLAGISKKVDKPRRKGKNLSSGARKKLSTAVVNSLSELVDCYVLFSFDVHGNSTVIINSANNMESRALSNLVEDFLSSGHWNPGTYLQDDEDDDDD
jgi:hypothetical protein